MYCFLFFTLFRTKCCSCAWIMSAKGDVLVDEEYKGKVVWLLEQEDVFTNLDKGLSIGVGKHHYDINISMIYLIKENEYKGRWNVNACAAFSVKISCVSHCDSFLEKVEKILCTWLSEGDGGCHTIIRKYMRACKRRQSSQKAPVSSPSLLSARPSGTVCHLITLTTFSQKYGLHLSKNQHKRFCIY
jgi:hypothetical protein